MARELPQRRVLEVNQEKFLKKVNGNMDAIWLLLAQKEFDLRRSIQCLRDPYHPEVVVFWQSLPNQFILEHPDGPIA